MENRARRKTFGNRRSGLEEPAGLFICPTASPGRAAGPCHLRHTNLCPAPRTKPHRSRAQLRLGLGAGGSAYRRGCARAGSTESSFSRVPSAEFLQQGSFSRAPSAQLPQQSSFSRAPSAEFLQPSSFSPPSCPGAAACVPQLFSRRETPVGSTEIPAAHVPRKEGARKRCWEAASPASAPCAVSFAALLFGWHPPGTPGSLLPCRSSTAAGQTLRPCKSSGGCSVLMGNMVTTCPLPYLD